MNLYHKIIFTSVNKKEQFRVDDSELCIFQDFFETIIIIIHHDGWTLTPANMKALHFRAVVEDIISRSFLGFWEIRGEIKACYRKMLKCAQVIILDQYNV